MLFRSEEVISRNFLLEEKPDCIINIVDVTNLERNLYLTLQLMEIDIPIVCELNMSDVLAKEGKEFDLKKLEEILLALTEQVTYRLRRYDLLANTVNVQLRTKDFEDTSHQAKLLLATSSTKEIYEKAKELLEQMYQKGVAIRLVGVRVDNLVEKDEQQLSLFKNEKNYKQE